LSGVFVNPAPPSGAALWALGRDGWLHAQPLAAALVLPLQRALFEDSPAHWDADPGLHAPAFAATRTLGLAEPGSRVDQAVRQLARAHTALALAMEQPATSLWPLSRRQPWLPTLNSRHAAPLVRARALLQPLALGARFNGALCFRAEAAPEAVRLWFWAERLGVFAGGLVQVWPLAGGALLLRLCAHGKLHVDAYGRQALQALDELAPHAGWVRVQGPCADGWKAGASASAPIAGRALRV